MRGLKIFGRRFNIGVEAGLGIILVSWCSH